MERLEKMRMSENCHNNNKKNNNTSSDGPLISHFTDGGKEHFPIHESIILVFIILQGKILSSFHLIHAKSINIFLLYVNTIE